MRNPTGWFGSILGSATFPTLVQERLPVWGRCIRTQRLQQRITAADLCARMGISEATCAAAAPALVEIAATQGETEQAGTGEARMTAIISKPLYVCLQRLDAGEWSRTILVSRA